MGVKGEKEGGREGEREENTKIIVGLEISRREGKSLCFFFFPSDINECVMGNDGCDPRGSCVNMAGSFQCTCDSLAGFQLGSDQRTCVGTYVGLYFL